MKLVTGAITLLVAALTVSAKTKDVDVLPSHNILPKNFKPPQVFKNTNLVRNINLEKGYVKETINVVVQNIDQKAQTVYYVPFDAERIGKIGGFAARDKNNAEKGAFKVDLVEYDTLRYL